MLGMERTESVTFRPLVTSRIQELNLICFTIHIFCCQAKCINLGEKRVDLPAAVEVEYSYCHEKQYQL